MLRLWQVGNGDLMKHLTPIHALLLLNTRRELLVHLVDGNIVFHLIVDDTIYL